MSKVQAAAGQLFYSVSTSVSAAQLGPICSHSPAQIEKHKGYRRFHSSFATNCSSTEKFVYLTVEKCSSIALPSAAGFLVLLVIVTLQNEFGTNRRLSDVAA